MSSNFRRRISKNTIHEIRNFA